MSLRRALKIAFTPKLPMKLILGLYGLAVFVQTCFIEPLGLMVAVTTTLGSLLSVLFLKLLAGIVFGLFVGEEAHDLPRGSMSVLAFLCLVSATILLQPFLHVSAQ